MLSIRRTLSAKVHMHKMDMDSMVQRMVAPLLMCSPIPLLYSPVYQADIDGTMPGTCTSKQHGVANGCLLIHVPSPTSPSLSPLPPQYSPLHQADIDGNGTIDFKEFLAATVHMHKVDSDANLRSAFDFFDSDGSGFIDIEELADALGADLTALKEILAEVDTNKVRH